MNKSYRVDFKVKNAAARKRGAYDFSLRIAEVKSKEQAAFTAKGIVLAEGFNLSDYVKNPKVTEIEAPTTDTDTTSAATAEGDTTPGKDETPEEGAKESVVHPVPEFLHDAQQDPELTLAAKVEEINELIKALKPGERLRLEDVPAEVYHKSEGWGSTGVKNFIESPAKAESKRSGKFVQKPTKAMRMGTAFHAAVIEPELFERDYSDVKASPLSNQQEKDDVIKMRDAMLKANRRFFKSGAGEVSYWRRYSDNLVLKCRLDWEVMNLASDLKSITDPSDESIAKQIDNYGYGIQQEHYKFTSGKDEFVFLFQENKEPFLTPYPVELDFELVEWAQLKLVKAYQEIDQSIEHDYWPVNRLEEGRQTVVVGLKPWRRKEVEELRLEVDTSIFERDINK